MFWYDPAQIDCEEDSSINVSCGLNDSKRKREGWIRSAGAVETEDTLMRTQDMPPVQGTRQGGTVVADGCRPIP